MNATAAFQLANTATAVTVSAIAPANRRTPARSHRGHRGHRPIHIPPHTPGAPAALSK